MKTKIFLIGLFCLVLAGCQNNSIEPGDGDNLFVLLSPQDSAAWVHYVEQGGKILSGTGMVLCLKSNPADTTITAEGGEVIIRVTNTSDYALDFHPEFFIPEDVQDQQCISLIDSKSISSKEKEFRFKVNSNEGKERMLDICFFSDRFLVKGKSKYLAGFSHIRQLSK